MTADTPAPVALAPCPFCNDKGILTALDYGINGDYFTVRCSGCLAEAYSFRTKDEVIAEWNKRAHPASTSDAMREALENARQELWVDFCLHENTSIPSQAKFDARPVIRIINAALALPPSDRSGE